MAGEPPDDLASVTDGPRDGGILRTANREARGDFAVVAAFSFAANLLVLALPLYMLQVYDRVLTSRSGDTLLMLTLLAVGLLIGFGVLDGLRQSILSRMAARWESRVDATVFDAAVARRLQGQAASEAEIFASLHSVRSFCAGPGILALLDIPWSPLFIGLIFLLHPALGAVALLGTIAVIGVGALGEPLIRPSLKQSYRYAVQSSRFAQSALRAGESLYAMGMAARAGAIWRKLLHRSIDEQLKGSDKSSALNATAKTVRLLLQVAILCIGAALVIGDEMSAGAMIAAVILMARAMAPAEQLFSSWNGIAAARDGYLRLKAVLAGAEQTEPELRLPAPQGAIEVAGLSGGAPGAADPFLHDISFTLKPGEMLGVIGPSGSGKTMLMRMLAGIWTPMAGTIRIDHAELAHWRRDELGKYVGYLPQDIQLIGGTVLSNIARLESPDHDAVIEAAKLAGVHEMILALPKGYDTPIGEGGSRLSAGQRQRLALARALYGAPKLLLLDEPNAFLDAEGEMALRKAIDSMKAAGSTIIAISHRPGPLAAADRLLVLRSGRIDQLDARDAVLPRVTRPVIENDKRVVAYRKDADER